MGLIRDVFAKTDRNVILEQTTIFDQKNLIELINSTIPSLQLVEFTTFFLKPFTHDQMDSCLRAEIINSKINEALYSISNLLPELGCEIKSVFKKIG